MFEESRRVQHLNCCEQNGKPSLKVCSCWCKHLPKYLSKHFGGLGRRSCYWTLSYSLASKGATWYHYRTSHHNSFVVTSAPQGHNICTGRVIPPVDCPQTIIFILSHPRITFSNCGGEIRSPPQVHHRCGYNCTTPPSNSALASTPVITCVCPRVRFHPNVNLYSWTHTSDHRCRYKCTTPLSNSVVTVPQHGGR